MKNFRFYIDGQEILQEPREWDSFEFAINFDRNNRTIITQAPLELTFIGDGYSVLKNLFNTLSIGQTVSLRADEFTGSGYETIYTGSINLDEINFDVVKGTAQTALREQSIASYLFSNMELEVNLEQNESRNGIAITPLTPIDLEMQLTGLKSTIDATGYDTQVTWKAYDVKEVFEYIVKYLSDGELTFRSNWYDALPDDERICLIAGSEAIYRDNEALVTSLDSLLKSIGRLFNLYMSGSGTEVILEDYSYFFANEEISSEVSNVEEMEVTFHTETLYKEIRLGDRQGLKSFFPDNRRYFAPHECFLADTYPALTDLNLQPEYVINANVILDAYVQGIFERVGAAHKANQATGNREIDILYEADEVPNGWYRSDLAENTYMVQYDQSTNTAVREVIDGKFYTLNPLMFNSAVMARYPLGADVYFSAKEDATFNLRMQEDFFMPVDTNSETLVSFEDVDERFRGEVEGGEFLSQDALKRDLYYVAPTSESKTFTIGMSIPKFHDSASGGQGQLAYGEPKRLDSTEVLVNTLELDSATIEHVGAGNPTLLFLSDKSYWSTGDAVSVEFNGPGGASPTDWEGVSASKTIQAEADNGSVISINLDSSSYDLTTFAGGTVTKADVGRSSLTNVDLKLKIVRTNSSGTIIGTDETTFQDIFSDTTYTHSASFDLNAGDEVYATTELIASETVNGVLTLPVIWRDDVTSADLLVSRSNEGYRGYKVSVSGTMTREQKQAVLREPWKAIGVPGGKGWAELVSISATRSKVKADLLTSADHFDF